MNETAVFLAKHRLKTHGDTLPSRADAVEFVWLCRRIGVRVWGFDGFRLFSDGRYVTDSYYDFSTLDADTQYRLILKVLGEDEAADLAFEIVHDTFSEDWETIDEDWCDRNRAGDPRFLPRPDCPLQGAALRALRGRTADDGDRQGAEVLMRKQMIEELGLAEVSTA